MGGSPYETVPELKRPPPQGLFSLWELLDLESSLVNSGCIRICDAYGRQFRSTRRIQMRNHSDGEPPSSTGSSLTELAGFRRPQPINDLKCLPSIDRAPIRRTRKTGNQNVSFHSLLILDPDCRVYPFISPWRELFLPPISPSSTHPFSSYLLFFLPPIPQIPNGVAETILP
ncbi:hypothetical protein BDV30DRAFT_199231 [Aspergillus minisclerotigenes]|uniref:Uncharacterized protein n=1 Tax=Aspergillus minisclerotigenes TaxID=656917 RepID=A0A5N6IQ53_9EURO|nr:hypothetical protein BDV30DRAFT_199231 [Aspergillus minisclerotigenes]